MGSPRLQLKINSSDELPSQKLSMITVRHLLPNMLQFELRGGLLKTC